MSAPQGSYACRITVSPSDADVLRVEAKKVLMFNHDPFEDLPRPRPRQTARARRHLPRRHRGHRRPWLGPGINPPRTTFNVPLTDAHIEQLRKRRADLLDTNLDLLTDIGADRHHNAIVLAEIHNNRHSVEALNRIFDAYTN